MKKLPIGSVVMTYNEKGEMISAQVQPITTIDLDDGLKKDLAEIKCADNSDTINHSAQLILAAWFSKMTKAELADRDKYTMVTEVVACDQYANKLVKQCTIKFTLQPIAAN